MKRLLMPVALLALAGCEAVETNATDGIADSNAQFEAAFNSGDAAGLAALYTEDAILMAPNMARLDGRPAIQRLWQHFFDADVRNFDLKTVELIVTGPRASEVGTFSMSTRDGRGGTLTAHGKYIVLWRLGADGVWRLHRDLWNNGPAAVELIAIEPIEPEVRPLAAVLDGSGNIVDGRPFVQVGVFSQPENATRLAAKLRAADLPANEQPVMLGQRQFIRVLVGPFKTIAERNSALEISKRIGIADAVAVRR